MSTRFLADTAVLTGRSLRHVTRSPDTIVTTTIMPIAFMLLFVYVFGGSIRTGSDAYVDYLLPGILIITVASGISYTAFRLFTDLSSGIFERFQSMPIARSAVLWAHVLTSVVASVISLAVVVLVALLMGFRSGAGPLAWLAVVGILVLFTVALTWIAVIWVGYRLLYQIPAFRYGIDVFKLGTPLVGSVVKMLALSKFYRAFASLHSAGASPSQAISNAARACGNWYITRSLMKAVPVVEMGRTFTEAMERTMIMPRMTLDMLATGEASGAVSDMVEKVADYSENEAEVRIHQLTMASGALLLLGICIYIGMTIIGSYLQHYKDILKAN